MFKKASQKSQAKLRRPTPNKFGDFDIEPTEKEIQENLKAKVGALKEELARLPSGDKRKKTLGYLYAEACAALSKQNKKVRFSFSRDFNNYLIDVIKPETSKAQWGIWMEKAKQLQIKDEAEKKKAAEEFEESTNDRGI